MLPPARAISERVLLTVGAQVLELDVRAGNGRRRQQTAFDAAAFDPKRRADDTRLNVTEARGEQLWTAAFAGSLGLFLEGAGARADDRGAAVALQVVPAPDLPRALRWLPWEVLFDPVRLDYLALKSGWSVVRGVDPFQAARGLSLEDLRVRVLVLNASPEAEAEAEAVREVMTGATVEIVRVRTAGELLAQLIGDVSVLHVIGAALGEGLVLAEGEGYAGRVEVAEAIASNHRIGLVAFSGDETAQVAEEVARLAPVTALANRIRVRPEHARLLSQTFYRHLVDAFPADVALSEARRAVDRVFPGERAWTGAVLLTGWPPLAPARPKTETVASDPGLEVAGLLEMMHSRNRDRARDLLATGEWAVVRRQLDEAEAALRRLRPPAAP